MTSILIVDDDAPLRERLARAFADRGLDVVQAADHDAAVELARARAFDRAVVDLRMPGPNGLVVVQDLRALQPTLQIVVVTGYGSIATAVDAIRHGARDYLTKPANADQILAAFDADPDAPPAEPDYEVPSLAKVEGRARARHAPAYAPVQARQVSRQTLTSAQSLRGRSESARHAGAKIDRIDTRRRPT